MRARTIISALVLVGAAACAGSTDAPSARPASEARSPPAPASANAGARPPCERLDKPPLEALRGAHASADDAWPELIARAPIIAVVEVTARFDECSGAGGTHVILRPIDIVRGPAIGLVHHGMHGYWSVHRFRAGDLFVAGIWPVQRADEDHDDNPDSSRAGWCLSKMPATEGLAIPLEPAASREAALARAHELQACARVD